MKRAGRKMKKLIKFVFKIAAIVSCAGAVVTAIAMLAERRKNKKECKKQRTSSFYENYLKRSIDCFLASCAAIVLSPVLLITALLVRMKLGSPVLFNQQRIGKDEKPFMLHKFRTMTDERDENGELLPNEVRLTPFGLKLRSTSIDELPELLNIIKGDMAIVGPRPLLEKYLPFYTENEHHRHDVRPGLTGLAQVTNNGDLGWDDKLATDVKYTEQVSLFGDAKIIMKTAVAVFTRGDTINDGIDPLDVERTKNEA